MLALGANSPCLRPDQGSSPAANSLAVPGLPTVPCPSHGLCPTQSPCWCPVPRAEAASVPPCCSDPGWSGTGTGCQALHSTTIGSSPDSCTVYLDGFVIKTHLGRFMLQSGGVTEGCTHGHEALGGCLMLKFFLGLKAAARFTGCVGLPSILEISHSRCHSTLGFEMGARVDHGDRSPGGNYHRPLWPDTVASACPGSTNQLQKTLFLKKFPNIAGLTQSFLVSLHRRHV